MTPTRREWIDEFSRAVGVEPPTESEVEELLELAAVAARASERTAAPITCWIAARSPLDFASVLLTAARIRDASVEGELGE